MGSRTVRDFWNLVEARYGLAWHHNHKGRGRFELWKKLCWLGERSTKIIPPETVPDIDATVILSDEEWAELEAEFNRLG